MAQDHGAGLSLGLAALARGDGTGDRHGAGLPVSAQTGAVAGGLAMPGGVYPPPAHCARVGRIWRGLAPYGLPPRARMKKPRQA